MPQTGDGHTVVDKEHRWLPVLSGQLPLVTFTRQDGEWKADPEFMSAVSQALIRHADEALKFRIVPSRFFVVESKCSIRPDAVATTNRVPLPAMLRTAP